MSKQVSNQASREKRETNLFLALLVITIPLVCFVITDVLYLRGIQHIKAWNRWAIIKVALAAPLILYCYWEVRGYIRLVFPLAIMAGCMFSQIFELAVRGYIVDFVPIGETYFNIADLVCIAACAFFEVELWRGWRLYKKAHKAWKVRNAVVA